MKFGEKSSKFDGLHGMDFSDRQKEIAEKFLSFCRDKPGWYRGTIDYEIDAEGNVVRIDEMKITMLGSDKPSEFFKERAALPETRWVPSGQGTKKLQHKIDGQWKDVPPFWIDDDGQRHEGLMPSP